MGVVLDNREVPLLNGKARTLAMTKLLSLGGKKI